MDLEKKRSSILKPQKPRNPLSDIDFDESPKAVSPTRSRRSSLRRVSFANSNFVKEFATDPDKNTVMWNTTYEEELSKSDSVPSQGSVQSHEDIHSNLRIEESEAMTSLNFNEEGGEDIMSDSSLCISTHITETAKIIVNHPSVQELTLAEKENIPNQLCRPRPFLCRKDPEVNDKSRFVPVQCVNVNSIQKHKKTFGEVTLSQNLPRKSANRNNTILNASSMEITGIQSAEMDTEDMLSGQVNNDVSMELTAAFPVVNNQLPLQNKTIYNQTMDMSLVQVEVNNLEGNAVPDISMELTTAFPTTNRVKVKDLKDCLPQDVSMEFTTALPVMNIQTQLKNQTIYNKSMDLSLVEVGTQRKDNAVESSMEFTTALPVMNIQTQLKNQTIYNKTMDLLQVEVGTKWKDNAVESSMEFTTALPVMNIQTQLKNQTTYNKTMDLSQVEVETKRKDNAVEDSSMEFTTAVPVMNVQTQLKNQTVYNKTDLSQVEVETKRKDNAVEDSSMQFTTALPVMNVQKQLKNQAIFNKTMDLSQVEVETKRKDNAVEDSSMEFTMAVPVMNVQTQLKNQTVYNKTDLSHVEVETKRKVNAVEDSSMEFTTALPVMNIQAQLKNQTTYNKTMDLPQVEVKTKRKDNAVEDSSMEFTTALPVTNTQVQLRNKAIDPSEVRVEVNHLENKALQNTSMELTTPLPAVSIQTQLKDASNKTADQPEHSTIKDNTVCDLTMEVTAKPPAVSILTESENNETQIDYLKGNPAHPDLSRELTAPPQGISIYVKQARNKTTCSEAGSNKDGRSSTRILTTRATELKIDHVEANVKVLADVSHPFSNAMDHQNASSTGSKMNSTQFTERLPENDIEQRLPINGPGELSQALFGCNINETKVMLDNIQAPNDSENLKSQDSDEAVNAENKSVNETKAKSQNEKVIHKTSYFYNSAIEVSDRAMEVSDGSMGVLNEETPVVPKNDNTRLNIDLGSKTDCDAKVDLVTDNVKIEEPVIKVETRLVKDVKRHPDETENVSTNDFKAQQDLQDITSTNKDFIGTSSINDPGCTYVKDNISSKTFNVTHDLGAATDPALTYVKESTTIKNFNATYGLGSPNDLALTYIKDNTAAISLNPTQDLKNINSEHLMEITSLTDSTQRDFNCSVENKPVSDFSMFIEGDYKPLFLSSRFMPLSEFNSSAFPVSLETTRTESDNRNKILKRRSAETGDEVELKKPMLEYDLFRNQEDKMSISQEDLPEIITACNSFSEDIQLLLTDIAEKTNTSDFQTLKPPIHNVIETTNKKRENIKRELDEFKTNMAGHLDRLRKNFEIYQKLYEENFEEWRLFNVECQVENPSIDSSVESLSSFEQESSSITVSNTECPPKILTLREKIEPKEKQCKKHWSILTIKDTFCEVATLYKTIKIQVYFNKDSGTVSSLYVASDITDRHKPEARYVHKIFMEKLAPKTIQSVVGEHYDILTLLDYVFMNMKKMLEILDEIKSFNKRFNLHMDENFKVTFKIHNLLLRFVWYITVDLSDVENIGEGSVSATARLGTVNEEEIKSLVKECPRGTQFLSTFIDYILKYVEILKKEKTLIKERNLTQNVSIM